MPSDARPSNAQLSDAPLSHARLSDAQRQRLRRAACLLLSLAAAAPLGAAHSDGLTSAEARTERQESSLSIATWGGSYEAAQAAALFEPHVSENGTNIDTVPYAGGIDILDDRHGPDLVDMIQSDAELACERGLLHPLSALPLEGDWVDSLPTEAGDGFVGRLVSTVSMTLSLAKRLVARLSPDPAPTALVPGALRRCSIAHSTYATLIGWYAPAFPGEKPDSVDDFFDIERFPGKRGVQDSPDAILEWALLAEGVPHSQIQNLLSTERGLRLAFQRLDTIRDHILWWDDPEQAAAWLSEGRVTMSSGFNGRFFAAQQAGVPLIMLWDGQLLDLATWAVPATVSGEALEEAADFIEFAMRDESQAALAERIPYGPSRLSALAHIGTHEESGIPMLTQLPSAPHHLDRALLRDVAWYAHTEELRQERFDAWRSRHWQP